MTTQPAHDTLTRRLAQLNADALLMEPRSVFDRAIIRITDAPADHWPRPRPEWVAVYCGHALVSLLMDEECMDCSSAIEWVTCNMEGAWHGAGTWSIEWTDVDGPPSLTVP